MVSLPENMGTLLGICDPGDRRSIPSHFGECFVDPVSRVLCGYGRGGDRLSLCTESLGSESCDERSMTSEEEDTAVADAAEKEERSRRRWQRREEEERRRRRLPPPLPWLGKGGGRFMRKVRENGRLVITEVRVERPEALQASRSDGRLQLHLVQGDAQAAMGMDLDQAKPDPEEVGVEEERQDEEEEELVEAPRELRERWEWVGGRPRCYVAVGSDGKHGWWDHRFLTTA